MKLFVKLFFISFCLLIIFTNATTFESCFAENTFYAKITTGNVYIYSSPIKDDEFKIFELPQSYFVELLKSANDDFYYCHYQDIYGYVLKEECSPVANIPTTPYLTDISFRIFVPSGANLRSSPYNNGSSNLIYSVPFLETNLYYYGTANGEEAISKKGNVWYYCKYFVSNTSYSGYIYSPLCDCLSSIPANNENVEYLQESPIFEEQTTTTSSEIFSGMSPALTTIIIVCVSLPCLLFIYLLFKPTKIAEETALSNNTTNKPRAKREKKKIKRLKHSDYFEIDDDF